MARSGLVTQATARMAPVAAEVVLEQPRPARQRSAANAHPPATARRGSRSYRRSCRLKFVPPARPHVLSLALVAGACGNSPGNGFPNLTEPAVTTVPAGSSSSGSSSSSSSGTEHDSTSTSTSSSGGSTSNDGSGGPKLDMPVPDGGTPPPVGCKGKIDFLFAISADTTMKNQQEQLIASFPGFIAAIKDQLPEFDVHVLSAKTHTLWAIPDCSLCTDSCDPQGDEPLCGATITPCDKGKLGPGVTFPAGTGASNRRCDLYGGNRYIISGEPNMEEMFDCIARVGISGGGRVAEAMVNALAADMNGPKGCNSGFLRDDALLVVVLIQDTYDSFSDGTPETWIEALRAAKHGDDDAFAVLALTTDVDDPLCEGNCIPWDCNQTKNPLRLLVEGVKHGFIGGICEPSFAPYFTDAVGHIVELCDSFVIPQ